MSAKSMRTRTIPLSTICGLAIPRADRLVAGCAAVLLVGAISPSALSGDNNKIAVVDCAKGQSINAALARSRDAVVVEIRGMCAEDVVIERHRTVLRGRHPNQDGITGVGSAT